MVEQEPGTERSSSIAYREMAHAEADRLYGAVVLLLGDVAVASELALDAWRRIWRGFDRGQILGDAEETLYRWGTRSALNRLSRSGELRGYQPPTTGDDRAITAMGIVGSLLPQQRAAVLLTIWGGLDRRTAAAASSIPEERVAEVAFATRQEYRQARGVRPPSDPGCHEIGPLLAAQLDGMSREEDDGRISAHLMGCEVCRGVRAAYEEFDRVLKGIQPPVPTVSALDAALGAPQEAPARVGGLRGLLRLASGPALLVVILLIALVIFRDPGEASIPTGVGRTSDLVYVRESAETLVIDAGSGREVGRLGFGVLSGDGERLYGAREGCGGRRDATAIWLGDTGTFETVDVGCAEGRLAPIAVDAVGGRLFLSDEAERHLLLFDLKERRLGGSALGPEGLERSFAPDLAVVTADRAYLFTISSDAGSTPSLLRTDLRSFRLAGVVQIPEVTGGRIAFLPADRGTAAWLYDMESGRLFDIDLEEGTVSRITRLGSEAAAAASSPSGRLLAQHGALAVSPDGSTLFVVLPEGGIAAVNLGSHEVERTLTADRTYGAVAVSTDGRRLYGLQSDGTYVVLDAGTGDEVLRRQRVPGKQILQVNAGN